MHISRGRGDRFVQGKRGDADRNALVEPQALAAQIEESESQRSGDDGDQDHGRPQSAPPCVVWVNNRRRNAVDSVKTRSLALTPCGAGVKVLSRNRVHAQLHAGRGRPTPEESTEGAQVTRRYTDSTP